MLIIKLQMCERSDKAWISYTLEIKAVWYEAELKISKTLVVHNN